MRWTLDVPEIQRYSTEHLIKMTRIQIGSKIQARVNSEGQEMKHDEMERQMIGSGKSFRYFINITALTELCKSFEWTNVTQYLGSNKIARDFLDEMIERVKFYLQKHEMDERNLFLFVVFFVLNVFLIPFCARITRILLFENDLSYRFFFLTQDWLNPTYEVMHLET